MGDTESSKNRVTLLVDSLPDSGSLAPIAVPAGPSRQARADFLILSLSFLSQFSAGAASHSNGDGPNKMAINIFGRVA
jgi:hypothetical protein